MNNSDIIDRTVKRFSKIFVAVFMMCLTACQDLRIFDEPTENENFSLYVGQTDRYVVKSSEEPEFSAGTLFHIYGTQPVADASDNWSDNLIKAESVKGAGIFKGISGDRDLVRGNARIINSYNPDEPITQVFRSQNMNLYSVTAVCAYADYKGETPEEINNHNAQLESWLMQPAAEDNIPVYDVKYDNVTTKSMPDIMWSTLKNLTPFGNAGKISMPFTHTLSKLNFLAAKADGLDPNITKMEIKSLSLTDYPEGYLSMENGLYTRSGDMAKRTYETRPIDFVTGEYVEVGSEADETFGSCLIFPTTGAGYETLYTGNVTDEQTVTVDLTIIVTSADSPNGKEVTFENVKLIDVDGKNAAFHPNTEYFITFTLTTSQAVVTLIPRYYEYIDVDMPVGDDEVGEPTDFGGVLWAAENLGASSAAPTKNALEWEKARGFYYQFGRNVPYYVRGSYQDPYPGIAVRTSSMAADATHWDYENERFLYKAGTADNIHVPYGNTAYSTEANHGARANPYIPILWENEIRKAGNTDTGYKNFLAGTRLHYDHFDGNGQTAPTLNNSDPHEAQALVASNGDITRYAFSCYYGYEKGTSKTNYMCARYWNKTDKANSVAPQNWLKDGANASDPCPKGWRVPSVSEFQSIFPTSVQRGDIAFNTDPAGKVDAGKTPHSGKVLWTETTDSDYLGEPAIYVGIYQDGNGYNDISIEEKFWSNDEALCKQGWGTIYGIKRLGTEEAYGLKWEIVTVDYDETAKGREENVLTVLDSLDAEPKIGRGVLVISKYDLEYQYAKENICITSEATGHASAAESMNAEYVCKGFVDSNKNKTWDTGETKFDIDWNHPSGKLYLPIPGYVIVPSTGGQGLLYPGTEALYWTSDTSFDTTYGHFGQAVRIKHAGDNLSRFLYISNKEHIANGANIRCVRDDKATD